MARNLSPEARRDRIKRTLVALFFVIAVIFAGGILIQVDSVSPGRIDIHAAQQIRALCGPKPTCTVRLAQLIPGDWDIFYEFSPSVPRALIDHLTRDAKIRTAPDQRVLVLTRNGHLLHRQYAHTGQTQPLANEVVFGTPTSDSHKDWVAYTPETELQVNICPTREGGSAFGAHGGTYYLLTPVTPGGQRSGSCLAAGDRTA